MASPVGRHEQTGRAIHTGPSDPRVEEVHLPTSCACAAVVKVRGVDEATLGLAASSNVMATVATGPSLRIIGIYTTSSLAINTSWTRQVEGRLDASLGERIITLWLVPLRKWKSTSTARSPDMNKSPPPSAEPLQTVRRNPVSDSLRLGTWRRCSVSTRTRCSGRSHTLRDEGLLEFSRGHGVTVTGAAPQRSVVVKQAWELVKLARRFGYGRDEFLQIIEQVP